MARKRWVAGNWKLNGTTSQVDQFCQELLETTQNNAPQADLLICPPFVYLSQMTSLLKDTNIAVGAQNVCDQAGPGAYTGEVSADMLADTGCSHVIVGHSERRHIYGESDEIVAAKFALAQAAGLTPILCVGESLEERESEATEDVLARQLGAVLANSGAQAFTQAIIAYEPVWAIGTGRTASPEQAQQAHAFLRAQIAAEDAILGGEVSILYGGSVKPDNAAELFASEDVDGGLIGGASLDAASLLAIARAQSS